MKKIYNKPQVDVVDIKVNGSLLVVSQSDPSNPHVSVDGNYTGGDID